MADTAERQANLLSSSAVPIYVAAAWLLDGPIRWAMAGMALLLTVVGFAVRRAPGDRDKWAGVVTCLLASGVWGWLTPRIPMLASAVLVVAIIYPALMLPARSARGLLVVAPMVALAAQFAEGFAGSQAVQAVAVAMTSVGLGLVFYRIRRVTAQRISDDTRALAEANARLENLSRTDGLTGLANRRRLDEALDQAWVDAVAGDEPVSVVMVDIDHFKSYNDHYGHLGGDDCLRKVAATLAGAIREGDLAARYGGEEFSVIIAGGDAVEVAERIRLAVSELAAEHVTAPSGRVTVSVGVATARPGEIGAARQLLEAADLSLYQAKRDGRNRVGPMVTHLQAA
ncbi:diguanylate cyclase (GGDEF) domain-containing protein [Actinoplanes derwentensis]|uniref:Diguanylate cyclase (GGDEF) domain-containing protein n=1 Tax=Actinoplanes derwentensis TaxID=113562 RepID=A0A1H1VA84_9ACTN|nr:diguanylate cyclase (GGDEF) domain-containing protein [Actinoplanes derwentensis]